jgi:hypothetical protein
MRKYEQEVFEEFEKRANVAEAWCIYDTIAISKTLYGNEQNAGWHTTWASFGGQERHSFFKRRTEGMVGAYYCNMQSADSMDFAFIMHSIGLSIFAPAPNVEGFATQPDGVVGDIGNFDHTNGHWFAADMPRHMGIEFKVQQDVRLELPALHCPPGYGASGGGVAFPQIAAVPAFGTRPVSTANVQQGVPLLSNRYPLPFRIGIPRTASIEAVIHLAEPARKILSALLGPQDMVFNSDDGAPPYNFFQKRYLVQVSLIGERLVQQRGQYFK